MEAFAALADPTRRRIVELLAREGELPAGDIAEHFRSARPTVSRHLRVLRDAGVVRVRSIAQQRRYALEPAALEELEAWLARYRRFWARHLIQLDKSIKERS
jgi:DNA-binding transcriptional ArsR family regulator